MATENNELELLKLEHLQNAIDRIEDNTFRIKTLCITLLSAGIAFSATSAKSAPIILSASIGVLVIFWLLDAMYLNIGRKMRKAYVTASAELFQTPSGLTTKEEGFFRVLTSWSVIWFYLAVLVLLSSVLVYVVCCG